MDVNCKQLQGGNSSLTRHLQSSYYILIFAFWCVLQWQSCVFLHDGIISVFFYGSVFSVPILSFCSSGFFKVLSPYSGPLYFNLILLDLTEKVYFKLFKECDLFMIYRLSFYWYQIKSLPHQSQTVVELGSSQCDSVDVCWCEAGNIVIRLKHLTGSTDTNIDCSSFQKHCWMDLALSVQILKGKISHMCAGILSTGGGSSCVRMNVKKKKTFSLKQMRTELRRADTASNIKKAL